MNVLWTLGRVLLDVVIDAAACPGDAAHSSGARGILVAAGLATLIIAAPGILIGLLLAGLAPTGP